MPTLYFSGSVTADIYVVMISSTVGRELLEVSGAFQEFSFCSLSERYTSRRKYVVGYQNIYLRKETAKLNGNQYLTFSSSYNDSGYISELMGQVNLSKDSKSF